MKTLLNRLAIATFSLFFGLVGLSLGQIVGDDPGLPFEGPDGPEAEALGQNSFGRGTVLRSIHNESVPFPAIGDQNNFLPPRNLPQTPRIYLTIRYYGCRPWFVHPYTGAQLSPSQIIRSVQTDCPTWPGRGRTLDELVAVDPNLGEPLVEISDGGLVDENNTAAGRDFQLEQATEIQNAANLGVDLDSSIQSIVHAPYYGLYCLRIRLCLPLADTPPGQVWRYWVRWPYRPSQSWCWSNWWWHRWQVDNPTFGSIIRPWRPLCVPHTWWMRAGSDWVFNIQSATRYRHFCLYAPRYYCMFWVDPITINPQRPSIGDLNHLLAPDPTGQFTTPWLRPYPYPTVRYWPFRPYCTRWFWFRPIPWRNYRYLPPVLHTTVATARPEHGGGFLANVNPN